MGDFIRLMRSWGLFPSFIIYSEIDINLNVGSFTE